LKTSDSDDDIEWFSDENFRSLWNSNYIFIFLNFKPNPLDFTTTAKLDQN